MAARKKNAKKKPTGLRWWQVLARGLVPVLVVVTAGSIYLALARSKPHLEQRQPVEKIWPIKAVSVAVQDHRPVLRLYGKIVAGRKVELHALVDGEVIETAPDFAEGARVAKDTLIVRIDPFAYESKLKEARANLKEGVARLDEIRARVELEEGMIQAAREQLVLSQRDHRRSTDLKKRGLVAQKAVDDKKIIVRDREQALRQRGGGLKVERARAAQQEAAVDRLSATLERAKRALSDTRLKAPFSGYLSSINVEHGRMLGVNDRVATLIDDQRIDVRFNLSDKRYGRILTAEKGVIGKPVKVFWRAMKDRPGYRATIRRVAAEVSAESGGVEVYARLEPTQAAQMLRSGTFVEVELYDRIYRNTIRLPEMALHGTDTVFVIRDHRLISKKIEQIGFDGKDVLVRGDLVDGDQVMTTRISQAGDGVRVTVQ